MTDRSWGYGNGFAKPDAHDGVAGARKGTATTVLPQAPPRNGQLPRALALARSMTDSCEAALAKVAGALARAGQYEQAEVMARSIPFPHLQVLALAEVAGALGQAGQHRQAAAIAAQAETVASSITDSWFQPEAIAEAAGALAWAGQHQQAEALARRITSPNYQATALAELAEALEQAGKVRSAARVTAAVCTIGKWPTAVTPVLLLVPSAFPTLALTLDEQ
jgi:hypothetical protein